MLKVFAREAYYIPIKRIDVNKVEEAHEANTLSFYKDKNCEKCPYFEERPCDVCVTCPNNLGDVRLSKVVERKGKLYLTLPIGDKKGMQALFPDDLIKVVKKHKIVPMRRKPNFLGKLKEFQTPAVSDIITGQKGVLKSAPRTGKTVMAAKAICKLGLKTLIIAAQHEWLMNFKETFVGSKTQEALTDINPKRIGLARKLEDYKRFDVALSTYQIFLSPKGKRLLKKLKNMFSVLIVDEVHKANATQHAKIVSKLNTKYKWGLTATPKRKDNRHTIVKKLFGPVLHSTNTIRLVPRLKFTPTNLSSKRDYRVWMYMIRYLETDPSRCRLIAEWAIKDAKKGHLILIPFTRIATVKAVAAAINRLTGDSNFAAAFYGGIPKAERDRIIQEARSYKIKVVVGNIKMISTGINIPRASAIYQCSPTSNMPNAEQRFSRILTPYEGKPQPLIRVFADDMNVVRACFRSEYWGALNRLFKPVMKESTRQRLFDWMNNKKTQTFHAMKIGKQL